MSGHSKWNNIKRKKEKTDGAKAKVFTKIGREISVAVRDGGPNPASNSKLADLIAKAKRMSVPNDNIQRIIKKAEGGDKTEFEAITYEGYGPGGVAVMVETLTDNRNRTAADLRHYFDKNGGNLGAMGCVAFLFSQKGVIDISLEDKDADEAMMDHRVWHRTAVAAQRLRLLSIKRNFARLRRIRPRNGYRIYRPAARRCRRACVLGKVRLCGRRQAAGAPPHAGPDRRQVRAGLSGRAAGTAAPLHRCYLRQRRRHGLPVRHHRAGRKGSRL